MTVEELYMREWGSGLALSLPKEVWSRLNLYHGKGLLCTIGCCRFLGRVSFKGRARMVGIPNALSRAADFDSMVGKRVEVDLVAFEWSIPRVLKFRREDWVMLMNPTLFPEVKAKMEGLSELIGLARSIGIIGG